jgi:hypothetical protein
MIVITGDVTLITAHWDAVTWFLDKSNSEISGDQEPWQVQATVSRQETRVDHRDPCLQHHNTSQAKNSHNTDGNSLTFYVESSVLRPRGDSPLVNNIWQSRCGRLDKPPHQTIFPPILDPRS